MGTSSSQRSPATPEWERVRELYRDPNAEPRQVASRLVAALDESTRRDLAGPGVASCLSTFLRGARRVSVAGLGGLGLSDTAAPAALHLAQALRQEAEQRILAGGYASRFADLGLNALGTGTLEAAAAGGPSFLNLAAGEVARNFGAYGSGAGLEDLSRCFLGHDFDHLFRYFVSRDLSDFIGTAALPTVSHGSRLRDAVTLHCRQIAQRVALSGHRAELETIVTGEADAALASAQSVLSALVADSLTRLAAEGEG